MNKYNNTIHIHQNAVRLLSDVNLYWLYYIYPAFKLVFQFRLKIIKTEQCSIV